VPSYNAADGDRYPTLDPIKSVYMDAKVLYTFLKDEGAITPDKFTPINNVV
jgi:hypothetical protein